MTQTMRERLIKAVTDLRKLEASSEGEIIEGADGRVEQFLANELQLPHP